MRARQRGRCAASRGMLACVLCVVAQAAAGQPVQSAALADLSLEQLSEVVVTSVSGREERLADAPASVFVIGADDIRRSGATSLPEALRLAPNLDVARADTNQYAIGARGFNNVLANKMLVMIDGRTVYTPLFSGVWWEAQDVMLEDVERIEVISGPGATLWGANAVNGVINIITRSAADTQGAVVSGFAGGRERGVAVRQGGAFADGEGHYRLYAKSTDRSASRRDNGPGIRDASVHRQAGFRSDWGQGARSITVQGDAYRAEIDQDPRARDIGGMNVLGRWRERLTGDGEFQLQAYYDRTERDQFPGFVETLDTFDVQAKHGFRPTPDQRLLWGVSYRHAFDRVENAVSQAFLPADRTMRWASVFAQDEIALSPRTTLTVGAKHETNPWTGPQFLPSIRLAWRPAAERLVWAAWSRAVRAPSRIDREFFVPGTAPFALAGGDGFQSEVAVVSELGYRMQVSPRTSFSVTAFHSDWDRLRSIEPRPGGARFENRISGATWGLEGWATVRVVEGWRVSAGGTLLRERLRPDADSNDAGGLASLGNDPAHWWTVRSQWDVTPRHSLDVALRHVAARPNPSVPAYTTVDARAAWRVDPRVELALVLRNLFDPDHAEWGAAANRGAVARTVLLQVLWRP